MTRSGTATSLYAARFIAGEFGSGLSVSGFGQLSDEKFKVQGADKALCPIELGIHSTTDRCDRSATIQIINS